MGNFIELEQEYGLTFNFIDPDKSIEKATELIQKLNIKAEWAKKRKRLLEDKIDVTKFMSEFIESYQE
jgi:predicted glycosyltransferase